MPDAAVAAWSRIVVLAAAAAVSAVALLGLEQGAVAYDFVQVYVPAGERVLDGEPLYPDVDDPVLRQNGAYVYPPLTAFLVAPLGSVPARALELVGVLGSALALFGALWLLGVRDPRCYAVFALWPPTILAWQNANLGVVVVLACALAWRFRDSWPRAGVATGFGIALKVLLWPLVVWLAATARVRAAALASAVAAVVVLGSWAVIGFDGLGSYPALLRRLTEIETVDTPGISIYAAAIELGATSAVATLASVVVGAGLLGACFAYGRRGDDAAAFTFALVAVLAFAPIVWLHYLTLLAVPLAVYRPRLSAAWALPLVFWVYSLPGWPLELRKLVAFVVVAGLVHALVAPGRPLLARPLRLSARLGERST